jgi:hypothetical protein
MIFCAMYTEEPDRLSDEGSIFSVFIVCYKSTIALSRDFRKGRAKRDVYLSSSMIAR